MTEERTRIIERALLARTGAGPYTMFTADEVLVVARIGEKQIAEFERKVAGEAGRLAGKE